MDNIKKTSVFRLGGHIKDPKKAIEENKDLIEHILSCEKKDEEYESALDELILANPVLALTSKNSIMRNRAAYLLKEKEKK
jgi:hypothetical protein